MTAPTVPFGSPEATFAYDMSDSIFFKKDARNYITVLSRQQINTTGNSSLLDIYLSADNVIEPHIHQNASELVYGIAGSAVISIVNPFTDELMQYAIGPGQVANIPQGWWHYETAMEDGTHLLAVFDAPVPEVIFGSDILRLTPASALAHAYCLDEAKVKAAFAPLRSTVIIGPPAGCNNASRAEQDKISEHALTEISHPGIAGAGAYNYPLRPVEPVYELPQQPFYPIPHLFRNWN